MTGKEQSRARKFVTSLLAAGALFSVYCLAVVGVSGLMMTATDTSAQARGHGGGGHHGGGHHGGGHHGGGHHHGHFFRGHAGWVHGHRYWWGGGWYCWYDTGWNGPGWYICGANW